MAESALGRGLDALIQKQEDKKPSKKAKKARKTTPTTRNTNSFMVLNQEKIDEIKEEVSENPRISLWSVKSASTLKYLKKTIPEFSISNEASLLLEEAISKKYPEIWELFDEE
ncbi:MAG: hypothetical protein BZ133_05435 [Methanosphaera sp. SHI613]|jgi:hypothetical protein|nr:MAG: hypothetical protein BZ133_05435 [Methanosphaera sp. SHI613]